MRVGVVDVGSNTVRLLVTARKGSAVESLHEEREYLQLGDEVERLGWISEAKLRQTVACVRGYARRANELDIDQLDVVITAPGRRAANADELVAALEAGAGARVRVLSAEEEALLAFRGALASLDGLPDLVAVCDSGGGSTEVVIGAARRPTWVRSVDVGSLTVRRLLDDDPPGKDAVADARAEVRGRFDGFAPPLPQAAFATGGTARALRKVVGPVLEQTSFDEAIARLAKRSSSEVARKYDVDPRRAWTLLGGAIVLAEVQARLQVPLRVAEAGMREGVAAEALAALRAA